MQAPEAFSPGTVVSIRYNNGHAVNDRVIVEWGEQGIVTSTEFHIHFTPFHRINGISVDREVALETTTGSFHDFLESAGVG